LWSDEAVTDCIGNVLQKFSAVTLLSHLADDTERQLKVRGTVVGTYSDPSDVGPPLLSARDVQVMITYVDASERHVRLPFPTSDAHTFGETETPEGNIVRWKAAHCRLGKKFNV